ncbi:MULTISPECIES: GNAT family N-acetyltransferase [Kitasatospora]|uniref:Aminoglycoside 2'-N-acetyltransferase I n=2 Tax=Kitasatospora TaxID=2063 RepID=A0ABT1J3U4_9ACTN|nr:GNAT family N-acetyltransferase [Kitasatospora paracochleata]MCP2312098.1 aminoglycoside 2'-N-acetyltransferase I [Kitasatospora paracochleata]
MGEIRVVHTAELDAGTLAAVRELLVEVFEGELTADDWEHCLGGVHVLASDGAELVGHAALVQRRLSYNGRALRAGYVEGVGVRADRRRQGWGGALMGAVERMVDRAYDLGALGASEDGVPFYAARGWLPWTGPTWALTPDGVVRTADEDGWIYVRPVAVPLDPRGGLTVCDWRGGDLW